MTGNSDKPPVADDEHLRDLAIVHPRNDLVDRGCFVHAYGIAGHDGVDPQGLHSLADELAFLSSEQPFEQEACGTSHSQFPPVEEIAFRDDPNQRPVVVERQAIRAGWFPARDEPRRAATRSV
jgi:hypothetical protein